MAVVFFSVTLPRSSATQNTEPPGVVDTPIPLLPNRGRDFWLDGQNLVFRAKCELVLSLLSLDLHISFFQFLFLNCFNNQQLVGKRWEDTVVAIMGNKGVAANLI